MWALRMLCTHALWGPGLSALGASDRMLSATEDGDLMTFVSDPYIRSPRMSIVKRGNQNPERGYWFIAPYDELVQREPGKLFTPGQIGPHIYADDGTLIWSGANLYPTRPVCDFRLTRYNGTPALSFIVSESFTSRTDSASKGVILDTTYSTIAVVSAPFTDTMFDVHELLVNDDHSTALMIYNIPSSSVTDLSEDHMYLDYGVAEIHIPSSKVTLDWRAAEHIPRNSTTRPAPRKDAAPWDWLHLNSVDRNAAGDLLISARHTDAVYKISRYNGSILWTLGGSQSSFQLRGFTFSRQHDARFVHEDATTTILSLLNNAADPDVANESVSSALLIVLDHMSMTATAHRRWERPDGQLSDKRGNAQLLPNGNMFVGWSGDDAYMTEHSATGNTLVEARLPTQRFSTYRSYKFFDYTATPVAPPMLKAFMYGTATSATTVVYVSWNGATEVETWSFYGSYESSSSGFVRLGSARKNGFETVFSFPDHVPFVIAQAVDIHGIALRNSSAYQATSPEGWSYSIEDQESDDDRASSKTSPEIIRGRPRTGLAGIRTFMLFSSNNAAHAALLVAFGYVLALLIRLLRSRRIGC